MYTWNDLIDPNFKYDSDSKKAAFAKKFMLSKVKVTIQIMKLTMIKLKFNAI